jgi:DNA-binding NtrC family response regulator
LLEATVESLGVLVRNLADATTFEAAADATLRAAIEVVEAALGRSSFAGKGRVLRAMVHLRPDDGYVRLVALEAGEGGAAGCKIGAAAHVPSATAWKWVAKQRAPVAVDVTLQLVSVLSGGKAGAPEGGGEPVDLRGSRMKLEGREVTHLLGVPMSAPGGRIEGMIAIEAACRDAIGQPFVWEACTSALETLATAAGPFLSGLPITDVRETEPDQYLPIIGASMQGLVEMLRVFARQEETILLGGPTGAGKTRLARWCHEQSVRTGQPFEVLDLSTVPEELQMGELFGWRRGAFTGAEKSTSGAIARAEKGTLFIDEIDKLSMKAQAGLLRVLEDRRYRPLGEGDSDRTANVRYIIGTNADLLALVRDGRFRDDLYYRINVLPVRIPPLAHRADEIIPWARHMLKRRHEAAVGAGEAELSDDAAKRLLGQAWPGNLRQLDNIIRRAYALSLVDTGGVGDRLRIARDHVEKALAYEGKPASRRVIELMEQAAEEFVIEAERRAELGKKLDMDHAEAFKGFVLEAARRRFGHDEKEGVRRAFVLLGKESTVESRNHSGVHRREMDKLEAARKALAGDPDAEHRSL